MNGDNGTTAQATARKERRLLAVTAFAWQHRFVTARHVLTRFHQQTSSLRTVNHWLKQLVDRRWITRIPIRSVLPDFPFVYIATGKGISILAANGVIYPSATATNEAEQRRPARGYGLPFVAHELGVTSFDLAMQSIAASQAGLSLCFTERHYHRHDRRLSFVDHAGNRAIQPDAGYGIWHTDSTKSWFDLIFHEWDRGTMRPSSIRTKLERYAMWAQSSQGEKYLARIHSDYGDYTQPSFRLLLVTQSRPGEGSDRDRLMRLAIETLELPRQLRRRLWMTTASDLRHREFNLASPVWYRAQDFKTLWNVDGRPPLFRTQRQSIAQCLVEAGRHPLFPTASPFSDSSELLASHHQFDSRHSKVSVRLSEAGILN